MNVDFVKENLVKEDSKTVDGIDFKLKRQYENGYIVKDISFSIDNENFNFSERVKAFTLIDFIDLFEAADVQLIDVFGDYKLRKFNKHTSERLIMIFTQSYE
jgi:hypothetical protein